MGKEVNVLRVSMVCLVLVAVLLLLAVVALGVGSAGYSLQQIIQALFYDESGPVRVVRQRRFYCCFRLWFHQCRFLLLAVRLWPVYLFICWPGAMGLILSE